MLQQFLRRGNCRNSFNYSKVTFVFLVRTINLFSQSNNTVSSAFKQLFLMSCDSNIGAADNKKGSQKWRPKTSIIYVLNFKSFAELVHVPKREKESK